MLVYVTTPQAPHDVADAVRRVVAEHGHDVFDADAAAATPMAGGARGAFDERFDALQRADMVLADASSGSQDVGWVTSWMLARGRLVTVLVARGHEGGVSAWIAGNPSPWQRLIQYSGAADVQAQLTALLG